MTTTFEPTSPPPQRTFCFEELKHNPGVYFLAGRDPAASSFRFLSIHGKVYYVASTVFEPAKPRCWGADMFSAVNERIVFE